MKSLWRRKREAPPPAREAQAIAAVVIRTARRLAYGCRKFTFAVSAEWSVSKAKCYNQQFPKHARPPGQERPGANIELLVKAG